MDYVDYKTYKEMIRRIEKIENELSQLNYNFGVRISKLERELNGKKEV